MKAPRFYSKGLTTWHQISQVAEPGGRTPAAVWAPKRPGRFGSPLGGICKVTKAVSAPGYSKLFSSDHDRVVTPLPIRSHLKENLPMVEKATHVVGRSFSLLPKQACSWGK